MLAIYGLILCCFLMQLKHFVCDFILQTPYMLGKFKAYPDFILPLLAHSAVQAFGTLLVLVFMGFSHFWWLAIIELVTHFIIDRVKADKNLLGRWKPDQFMFWIVLGYDQFLHSVVSIVIMAVCYLT